MENDVYKTILKPSKEVLFKDKNSKFFGYAFPVSTEEDVKSNIKLLKKQHHTARHWCYAYQLGTDTISYRANDDGEPNNSAGMPIYGQIQSFEVTNILIVVVRYFGGTKLGVSGLINAYKTTAQMTLDESDILEKTINKRILVSCSYDHLNKVMRIIKEKGLKVFEQDMKLDCKVTIQVRLRDADTIFNQFKDLHHISVKYVD